jgi:hypothetical protein
MAFGPPEDVFGLNVGRAFPIRERLCDCFKSEPDFHGGPAAFRRRSAPNAEEVAKFFHETYEKLAPEFGYETRKESAVPWEEVPEKNRRLMVAVAAIVIGRYWI